MPVVTATGVIANGAGRRGAVARSLEAAMKAAVESAHADGITAPHEIRQAVLTARDETLAALTNGGS